MAERRTRFVGVYPHGIDEKGRMVLPAKIRAQLGETAMLAKLDNCIGLFPLDEFDRMSDRYEDALDAAQESGDDDEIQKALTTIRRFSGDAHEVTPDQQGRIVVPAILRDYADLTGEVVTVGVLRRAELWNRDRWFAEGPDADEEVRRRSRSSMARGRRQSEASPA